MFLHKLTRLSVLMMPVTAEGAIPLGIGGWRDLITGAV